MLSKILSMITGSAAPTIGYTMAGTGETEDHSQPYYGSSADANIGGDQPDRPVVARERNRHGGYSRHMDSEDSSNGARTHRSGRQTYAQHGDGRSPSVQAHRHHTRGQLNESSHSLGTSELENVRRELEATKAEMERKAGDFARQARKLNGDIERLEREREELEATKTKMARKIDSFDSRARRWQDEIKALEHEREKQQEAGRQLRQLLDARTRELRDAQSLLAKPDVISEADAVKMVQTLNDEIYQAAAIIATELVDECEGSHETGGLPGMRHHTLREHRERLATVVGEPMVHMLSDRRMSDPNVDASMLVQIALQGIMAVSCVGEIQSWGGSGAHIGILEYISQRMGVGENQMVYANWRALTLKYASGEGDSTQGMTSMAQGIVDVSITAGLWAGDSRQFENAVLDRFNQKLLAILKHAQRIRQAVGQSITSADLRVYVVFPPEKYDARSMDDAYGEAGNPAAVGSDVFGSTSLGMFRIIPRTGESQMLVKPQVVLGPTIQELLAYDEADGKR